MTRPDAGALLRRLRETFETGRTRERRWREGQLDAMKRMLLEREADFAAALAADLGKGEAEIRLTEIGFTINEIDHVRGRLRRWMAPERVPTPIGLQPGRSHIRREPYGVALIIAPWNYPVQLLLSPLIGAIAAGNCAVVKPSEVTAECSRAFARWIPEYLDTDAVAVVEGGKEPTTALLKQRFDKIFYTGGERVGQIVMEAAAKHLTPVTLEMGGKSPAIVLDDAYIPVAARRIVQGRFMNAGQTCVSPDYVLVQKGCEQPLVGAMNEAIDRFFGPEPKDSPDYGRIVNKAHFDRLSVFLKDGEIAAGGTADAKSRYIAPTILTGVSPQAPVMQEEIFGPILPVLPVEDVRDAIRFVNERPKPLSLYIFSGSRRAQERVLNETSAGGACVNETVFHLGNPNLPFGGVGRSGMGAYHGFYSFEAFSHRKSVLARPTWPDIAVRYPPFTKLKTAILKRVL